MTTETHEKCKMCHGKMSHPKMSSEGPRKGQMKTICFKCGWIHYYPSAQTTPAESAGH